MTTGHNDTVVNMTSVDVLTVTLSVVGEVTWCTGKTVTKTGQSDDILTRGKTCDKRQEVSHW